MRNFDLIFFQPRPDPELRLRAHSAPQAPWIIWQEGVGMKEGHKGRGYGKEGIGKGGLASVISARQIPAWIRIFSALTLINFLVVNSC